MFSCKKKIYFIVKVLTKKILEVDFEVLEILKS